jgi:hypothetical protein
MPKALEDCVKAIKGTNKKTGKPYTKSEKYAICNSRLKKSKSSEAEIIDDVTTATFNASQILFQNKVVPSIDDARMLTDALLARADYDVDRLETLVAQRVG